MAWKKQVTPNLELFDTDLEATLPKKRIADRPHWVTILIGIGSPTLGIIALVISLQSLKTSQQAMKIGQRAYLSLSEGKVALESAGEVVGGNVGNLEMRFQFKLANTGNTPAHIDRVDLACGGSSTTIVEMCTNLEPPAVRAIGAKESVVYQDYRLFGALKEDIKNLQMSHRYQLSYRILGVISYRDVFEGRHSLLWCWHVGDEDSLSDCSTYELDREKAFWSSWLSKLIVDE